jgi:protease IV
MKLFLKTMFASMFGFILSFFIFFLIIVASSAGGGVKPLKESSVLELKLEGDLPDRANNDPFANFNPFTLGVKSGMSMGLFELKKIIEHAKEDDKIKGIYLNAEALTVSSAVLEEVKKYLLDFKESGKFIVSYANYLPRGAYLLHSVADTVYLNPNGMMEFLGMSAQITFYTGLLEKLNIEPMIFYAGEFKSATEPFRLKSISDENKEQLNAILEDLYANYLQNISSSRGIDTATLHQYAMTMAVKNASDALRLNLVDALVYEDEVLADLRKRTGIKEDEKVRLASLSDYKKSIKDKKNKSKNTIAVLYAEGEISDGEGTSGVVGGDSFVQALRDIRKDKKVKALVLRVNSPGGSGFASDIIWRELRLLKQEKKIPIIVSMGSVAASGGYYIAAPADTIVAERNTITGSIGVFAMLFNTEDAFREKAGITFDRVKTAPYADLGNPNREWAEEEKDFLTDYIKEFYDQFLDRVAKGRNMDVESVDKIARGRVWTGQDAKDLGLVDILGNLDDAVAIAAKSAGLKDYKLEAYPEQKSFLDNMLDNFISAKTEKAVRNKLGPLYPYAKEMELIQRMQGIQARLPYIINIK